MRRVAESEMQRCEPTHRQPDDMRLIDPQMIEHITDILSRANLRIFRHILRHV